MTAWHILVCAGVVVVSVGIPAALVVVACILCQRKRAPFDITHDDDQPHEDQVEDEPMTAPGPAHPASRAIAARESWVDGQGDHFAAAVPVAEVVPFVEPPRTCSPEDDAAICSELEAGFTAVEQSRVRASNRELSNLPHRGRS